MGGNLWGSACHPLINHGPAAAADQVLQPVAQQAMLFEGHQRLAVLQHLGYTSAEVSVVDLDEKEEKLLNVALNKIKGQWDYSRLEEIFQEYELEEAKVTGFTGQEIALILAKNDDVEDPAAWQDDDEYEEDEDPDFLGASWVVTLTFRSSRDAQRWIDRMGYDATAKAGKKTTVIRMEE